MKKSLPDDFRFEADAVAIGASAGGIDALFSLLSDLPAGYPLPLIAVLHVPESHDSRLAAIFTPRVALPVREAEGRAAVAAGTLYFAPNGYHLLVENDHTFSLNCDPPVLYSRPSIDVLMESCADAWGARLAGIVLTGASEDGARGLAAIRECGGLTAVQDPEESAHPTMPLAAIAKGQPDFVLPIAGLTQLLKRIGGVP